MLKRNLPFAYKEEKGIVYFGRILLTCLTYDKAEEFLKLRLSSWEERRQKQQTLGESKDHKHTQQVWKKVE